MSFKITLDGISHPAFQNKTILQNLESHQVTVEFQCREGFCGACRMTKVIGNVEYTEQPIALLRDNEILPCCCKPTSDITVVR